MTQDSNQLSCHELGEHRLLCEIYRSPRKDEMYLYVDKRQGLADVPEPLLKQFGSPQSVMTLILHPERSLARANVTDVISAIREQGFYLQMPPKVESVLPPSSPAPGA